jgi:alpha-tubulin suppressor-like RCC1 family protein
MKKQIVLFTLLMLSFLSNAQLYWKKVSAGSEYNIALRSDGTLWSWGFNGNGQLGIGDNTAFDFPVQVGTATDWSDIACGSFHVLALKTDGTLWAWGLNSNGQLGISNK